MAGKLRWTIIAGPVIAAVALFPLVQSMMLTQSLTYLALQGSNDALSVNFLVALYLYGLGIDRLAKRLGQRKSWVLWGIGMVAIILTLKYIFGWETRLW